MGGVALQLFRTCDQVCVSPIKLTETPETPNAAAAEMAMSWKAAAGGSCMTWRASRALRRLTSLLGRGGGMYMLLLRLKPGPTCCKCLSSVDIHCQGCIALLHVLEVQWMRKGRVYDIAKVEAWPCLFVTACGQFDNFLLVHKSCNQFLVGGEEPCTCSC